MLWRRLQSIPQYANKTSLLITTDHGRGEGRTAWKSHGVVVPGSHLIWAAALGPDTPALGVRKGTAANQAQIAATLAKMLGEDFTATSRDVGQPIERMVK